MTIQRVRWITIVATLFLIAWQIEARAQMPPGPMSPGQMPPGHMPPGAMLPGQAVPGGVAPAAYGMGMPAGAGMPDYPPVVYEQPGHSGRLLGGHGHSGRLLGGHGGGVRSGQGFPALRAILAPYGEGGCCAPRWFDVHMEAVFMNLDVGGPSIVFSQDLGRVPQITTSDLDPSNQPGLRASFAYQTGPGSNLEFTFLGLLDYSEVGRATSETNGLVSVFSNFTDLNPPDGLEQFDLASLHEVRWNHQLNNFELNYRRRWRGPTCNLHGSWLMGVRQVQVHEKLRFDAVVDPGVVEGYYELDARNSNTGFQLGGDLWVCLLPGLNVGMETKAGIFGNAARQTTNIWGIDGQVDYRFLPEERIDRSRVSFVGEVSAMATYRLNPNFTIRGGYQLLFIDRLALARQNFNPDIPELLDPQVRTAVLDDRGSVFYDGFTIGAEWMW